MALIGALLGLILFLVILGVIVWGLNQILAALAPYIAEPFLTIIRVAIVVVCVIVAVLIIIWLLGLAGLHVQLPHLGG